MDQARSPFAQWRAEFRMVSHRRESASELLLFAQQWFYPERVWPGRNKHWRSPSEPSKDGTKDRFSTPGGTIPRDRTYWNESVLQNVSSLRGAHAENVPSFLDKVATVIAQHERVDDFGWVGSLVVHSVEAEARPDRRQAAKLLAAGEAISRLHVPLSPKRARPGYRCRSRRDLPRRFSLQQSLSIHSSDLSPRRRDRRQRRPNRDAYSQPGQ